jgi:molybdenum cofactor cytidylyltransferase
MRLADALRINPGDVVAFVGAGGKTSAIRKLTSELSEQIPTLVTTTTKLGSDQSDLAQEHLILKASLGDESIHEHLQRHNSLLVTGESDPEESKWLGLEVEEVHELVKFTKAEGVVLLVEADGARGKSLKVPKEYEPVLPELCDLVVPIVGLDVLGERLPSPLVHRHKLVRQHLALEDGEQISIEHVIRILNSQQGGLKGVPSSSKIRVLLNKADTERDIKNGREIAEALIKNPAIQSVLLASTFGDMPVHESFCRVAGVILAAGKSSRFGGIKQYLHVRGKPMLLHAVDAAMDAGLAPIIVVTGEVPEEIGMVFDGLPIQVVKNPQPEKGQSSSLRLGLESIHGQAEAVVYFLADMPLVSSELVRTLVWKHRRSMAPVIVPIHEGRKGNPVLFDQVTYDDLMRTKGDRGGRALFESYPLELVEWDDSIHFDVDSEEDLSKLKGLE